ncbi:Rieske (2Fe-2S) protein [Haloechinothrix halophila]|uniref:Rieske (2Fe-2S) protein n=1 Tax=Haloechinothrix halophila TaxID=1069073 RepID=UPI000550B0AA|nr:Rieske (2Fe-2S) protein [Haloechinothrix halophila]
MSNETGRASRRAVIVGVGAGALAAGCTTYGRSTDPPPPASADSPAAESPAADASASAESGGGGAALGSVSDVPVGGGRVFGEQQIVVTQPSAGTIRAFSSICTHQGCTVANVSGGTINCTCHGSKFRVADGAVAGGPAPEPLPERDVVVDGDEIRLR